MISLWCVLGSTGRAQLADTAVELGALVRKHGHHLPLPVGYGWETHPALALAVNALYTYVPTPKSPPVLTGAHSLFETTLVQCTKHRACSIDETALGTADDDKIVTDTLEQLVRYHGHAAARDADGRLAAATFAAFDVPSYACDADVDCAQFGAAYNCCDRGTTVPGVCCSQADLNQYDAPVPLAVLVTFLVCAGLVLLWILFNRHFRSVIYRLLGRH